MSETMLVTQALNELKVLDSRINRVINESNFVCATKKSEKNAKPGITKEDFNQNAKSSKQSIDDLIIRRKTLKDAIIKSNAVTIVEIGNEKMTVAEAIDTKDSIRYKKNLLQTMLSQYSEAVRIVELQNMKVEDKINDLIATAYGKDGKDKVKSEDYNAIADPFKEKNEYGLVDPLLIKEEIDKLETYIETFESEVDAKLQISNCVTTIEI